MILLVEDNRWEGEEMKRLLEREGYAVHWEMDGEAALAAVRRAVPELVVLDEGLPDISGTDVLFELRRGAMAAKTAVREVPVLFLSAGNDRVTYLEASYLGTCGWFMKELFDEKDFLTAVRDCVAGVQGKS